MQRDLNGRSLTFRRVDPEKIEAVADGCEREETLLRVPDEFVTQESTSSPVRLFKALDVNAAGKLIGKHAGSLAPRRPELASTPPLP